jgi:hypothetical protein
MEAIDATAANVNSMWHSEVLAEFQNHGYCLAANWAARERLQSARNGPFELFFNLF